MVDFNGISRLFSPPHANAGAGHQFRPGDFVFVKVLEQSSASTWKVSIGGKLFSAVSNLPLRAGETISARVRLQGNTLHLSLPGAKTDAVTAFLRHYGLPVNVHTQALVSAFLRNGRAVDPGAVDAARKILERAKGSLDRNARFLAVLSGKGIDFRPPPSVDLVNEFFSAGDDSGGSEGGSGRYGRGQGDGTDKKQSDVRESRNSRADIAGSLEDAVRSKSEEPSSLLQLFNHMREDSKHWIAIPVRFSSGEEIWDGMIRILMDDVARKPLMMSVSVSDGTSGWSFVLNDESGKKSLQIFADNEIERKRAELFLPELRELVGNLGVRLSERVVDAARFDGFSSGIDENGIGGIDLSL